MPADHASNDRAHPTDALGPDSPRQHNFGLNPSRGTISRQPTRHALAGAGAGAWWNEIEDVRARIEHRRAIERVARHRGGLPPRRTVSRRTVTITGRTAGGGTEMASDWDGLESFAVAASSLESWPGSVDQTRAAVAARERAQAASGRPPGSRTTARRRRQRSRTQWLGSSPDRFAAWAVALGFLLVIAALLSPH